MERLKYGVTVSRKGAKPATPAAAVRATRKWRSTLRGLLERAVSPRPWWKERGAGALDDEDGEEEESCSREQLRAQAWKHMEKRRAAQDREWGIAYKRRWQVLYSTDEEGEVERWRGRQIGRRHRNVLESDEEGG